MPYHAVASNFNVILYSGVGMNYAVGAYLYVAFDDCALLYDSPISDFNVFSNLCALVYVAPSGFDGYPS